MKGKCLMIVGMHRSGTSLTSSILQSAGLFVGEELMEASSANKNGYYENVDFYNFQVNAFKSLSLDIDGWDLQTIEKISPEFDAEAERIIAKNDKEEWGWKEPRTTLFMKYWEHRIPTIRYFFVYRNPWDVADSLYRRGSDKRIMEDSSLAFKAWNFYNQEIIKMYKLHKEESIIMHIDDFIENIPSTISEINNRFGFHLNENRSNEIFDASLYKPAGENYFRSWQASIAFPEVMDTLNELRALCGKEPYKVPDVTEMFKYSKAFNQMMIGEWHKVYSLKSEVKALNRHIDYLNSELDWMKKTPAWKLRSFLKKITGGK